MRNRIDSTANTCIPMYSALLFLKLSSMIVKKSAKDKRPLSFG